jgi:hypothetical protein
MKMGVCGCVSLWKTGVQQGKNAIFPMKNDNISGEY